MENIQAKTDGKYWGLYMIIILDAWPRQGVMKKAAHEPCWYLAMSVPGRWNKQGQGFEVGAPGILYSRNKN